MATLDIEGRKVQVDDSFLKMSPDDQHSTVDEIAASFKPQGGLSEDLAKSTAAGLGTATIGTFGMAGDASNLLARGSKIAGDYIGGKMGFEPSPEVSSHTLLPTSQDIRSTVTDPIVPPEYEPKTALGGFAKTGAEFLPAAVGGPEGLGAKLLTRVAVPAAVSETAGQLTKDTAAEPWARAAGALAGGVGAPMAVQKFKAMAAARNVAAATPSAENLLSTAGKQFEDVKASDLVIKPAAVEGMAKDIKTELLNDGFHPDTGNQKGVFNALDRLEALGKQPGGVTPKDMEVVRKNLVGAKTDMDQSTAKAARDATKSFMDKYSTLGQGDVLNGDAQKTFGTLKDAIGNYAAGKRSNTITGKIDLGNLNAATAGSGANEDNALRQAFKQLARPVNNTNIPKWQRLGFNKDEGAAIEQAARGTVTGNTARYLGKAAPTGIVSAAMSGGAGHMAGGPIGAVALPVAGYIAKKIGDLSTKRAVAAVDSLVRSRSPLAQAVAAQVNPQIIAQLPARTQRILQATAPARLQVGQTQNQTAAQPNPPGWNRGPSVYTWAKP